MLSMNDLQEKIRNLQQQLAQKEEQIADLQQQLQGNGTQSAIDPDTLRYKSLLSIGYFFPGIVHNLSNPLTVIAARTQLLGLKMPEEKSLDTIYAETRKIESILNCVVIKSTNELDTDSKKLDLKKLLETELEFLQADANFKHNIQKVYHIDEKIPGLQGVYCHFSQLFLSLLAFAIHSLREAPQKQLEITVSSNQQNIVIRIHAGACTHTLADLHDFLEKPHPDFYEKGSQEALLYAGLYEAGQIARLYQGRLSVEGSKGQDLKFCVELPYKAN